MVHHIRALWLASNEYQSSGFSFTLVLSAEQMVIKYYFCSILTGLLMGCLFVLTLFNLFVLVVLWFRLAIIGG